VRRPGIPAIIVSDGPHGYDAVGREVSFPVGHGLSYTTFDYSDLDVSVTGSAAEGDLAVDVTCTVTNTGGRAARKSCSSTSAIRRPASPGRSGS
jgi:hypothetical protein